jgi:hypothetical protein
MRIIDHRMSLESSIQFQGTQFRDELILAMEAIDQLPKNKVKDSEEEERVSHIIKEYTNLNITVTFGEHQPSIHVPDVNKNNILIQNFLRNYIDGVDGLAFLAKNDGIMRGTVDLVRNKVSGVFAEFPAVLRMPLDMVDSSKYDAGKKAAVVLHEVGHLFYFCAFMASAATTSQALSSMSKALDMSGTIDEREVVMLSVKKALKLKDLDEKALAKCSDRKVVEAVVISSVARESRSQLGRSIYDSTSWEYLADQYATRCGAGRDLAIALDTIYKGSWNISFRSLPGFLFMEVVKIASIFLIPVLAVFMIAMDGGDSRYDKPGARMIRIRSQIIENLKDRDLDKEDVARLEEDINIIDRLLKDVNDRRQFFGVIWDVISPTARKDRNYTQLQQELEVLGTNDLFLKAAQLRTSA